jgi:hypothetical protein
MLRLLFDDFRADFATMVRRACGGLLEVDDPRVDEMLSVRSPAVDLMARGHDWCTTSLLTVAGEGIGSPLLTVARYESLVDDLLRFLAAAGVRLREGAADRLRASLPVNATAHLPYRAHYGPALRERVRTACALVDRFGYGF